MKYFHSGKQSLGSALVGITSVVTQANLSMAKRIAFSSSRVISQICVAIKKHVSETRGLTGTKEVVIQSLVEKVLEETLCHNKEINELIENVSGVMWRDRQEEEREALVAELNNRPQKPSIRHFMRLGFSWEQINRLHKQFTKEQIWELNNIKSVRNNLGLVERHLWDTLEGKKGLAQKNTTYNNDCVGLNKIIREREDRKLETLLQESAQKVTDGTLRPDEALEYWSRKHVALLRKKGVSAACIRRNIIKFKHIKGLMRSKGSGIDNISVLQDLVNAGYSFSNGELSFLYDGREVSRVANLGLPLCDSVAYALYKDDTKKSKKELLRKLVNTGRYDYSSIVEEIASFGVRELNAFLRNETPQTLTSQASQFYQGAGLADLLLRNTLMPLERSGFETLGIAEDQRAEFVEIVRHCQGDTSTLDPRRMERLRSILGLRPTDSIPEFTVYSFLKATSAMIKKWTFADDGSQKAQEDFASSTISVLRLIKDQPSIRKSLSKSLVVLIKNDVEFNELKKESLGFTSKCYESLEALIDILLEHVDDSNDPDGELLKQLILNAVIPLIRGEKGIVFTVSKIYELICANKYLKNELLSSEAKSHWSRVIGGILTATLRNTTSDLVEREAVALQSKHFNWSTIISVFSDVFGMSEELGTPNIREELKAFSLLICGTSRDFANNRYYLEFLGDQIYEKTYKTFWGKVKLTCAFLWLLLFKNPAKSQAKIWLKHKFREVSSTKWRDITIKVMMNMQVYHGYTDSCDLYCLELKRQVLEVAKREQEFKELLRSQSLKNSSLVEKFKALKSKFTVTECALFSKDQLRESTETLKEAALLAGYTDVQSAFSQTYESYFIAALEQKSLDACKSTALDKAHVHLMRFLENNVASSDNVLRKYCRVDGVRDKSYDKKGNEAFILDFLAQEIVETSREKLIAEDLNTCLGEHREKEKLNISELASRYFTDVNKEVSFEDCNSFKSEVLASAQLDDTAKMPLYVLANSAMGQTAAQRDQVYELLIHTMVLCHDTSKSKLSEINKMNRYLQSQWGMNTVSSLLQPGVMDSTDSQKTALEAIVKSYTIFEFKKAFHASQCRESACRFMNKWMRDENSLLFSQGGVFTPKVGKIISGVMNFTLFAGQKKGVFAASSKARMRGG